MRFKKQFLGLGLGSLLLIGGNMGPRQAIALEVRLPPPPPPPPAPCTEILSCAPNGTTFQVEYVDDGCSLGFAQLDDCSADVTKALTSAHGCSPLNGPSDFSGLITYSIFCNQ
jgi:hypothetical protein